MRVLYTRSAEKEILSLDRKLARRISQKIGLLKDNPFGRAAQKLGGGKGYRIRIGDYRVVYTVNQQTKTITIIRIRHRREVYRK